MKITSKFNKNKVLVNDLINVVTFKDSKADNKPLVDDLETYQEKGWKKEIEQRKCKLIEQRNAARKRLKLNEMKRKERLQRLTNHSRHRRNIRNNTSRTHRDSNHNNMHYRINGNEKEKMKNYMEEYIQKVTKHIGMKKEAAVWKQVPQPGRMPKPPYNT